MGKPLDPVLSLAQKLLDDHADPLAVVRVTELVRLLGRVDEEGNPFYAKNEAAVLHPHDPRDCFVRLGLEARSFSFVSSAMFDLPLLPSDEFEASLEELLGDARFAPSGFIERLSAALENILGLSREEWTEARVELMDFAANIVPEDTHLLKSQTTRSLVVVALASAALQKPEAIDVLEPVARLLADAVPLYEGRPTGSGHWLLLIA